MEDKIEVEEYVRTEDGIIDKVTEYRTDCHVYYCEKEMIIDEDNSIGTPLKQIVKHSEQLIDLIEVDDFVNGYRVLDKYLFAEGEPVLETEGNDTNCKCLCEKDIKIILTKESYMANCYKVGEKNE